MPHNFRKTAITLADGRELIYFDDTPEYVSGEKTRETHDSRELPQAMSTGEMRYDQLTGEWIAIASHRNNRTFMPAAADNPLAPTKPGNTPTEIPADDYDVVVFENRFPSFTFHIDESGIAPTVDGEELFKRAPAKARCEVVCFTSNPSGSFRDLPTSRVRTVIEAWVDRTAALKEMPGIRDILPFENRGEEIGVTLQHPHGQIYAYPFLAPRTAQLIAQSEKYHAETGRKLIQDVLEAEERAGTRVIFSDEHFTAYVPTAARWPVEVILTPRRDVADFTELTEEEKDDLAVVYPRILRALDNYFEGVEKTPYIAAWHQAPVGEGHEYGKLYLHLFSLMRAPHRMKFLAGSESAAGAWINDSTPEDVAARFRELLG